MKKGLLSLAAMAMMASAAFAQYYYIPEEGQNPRGLSTDAEWPPNGGLPSGWTTIFNSNDTTRIWTNPIAIPFAFDFNGNTYTSLRASTSGVVTFTSNPTIVPGYDNQSLPHSDIPDNSICVWGLRPQFRSFATGYANYILTKTFGTAPNRQFWISYNLFGEPNIQSGWAFFSIVLEETTNRVYIVDQKTVCVNASQQACTGKTGLTLGLQFNSSSAVMVDGSPNYQNRAGSNAAPDDNVYYEFIAGTQPAVDVKGISLQVEENLALPQAPFDIIGRFRNIGTNAITSGTFNYSVNGGAAVSNSLSGLNVAKFAYTNATATTKWTPTTAGTYTIKAWISSPNGTNDEDPANDTITMNVRVWENFVPRKSLFEVFTSSTCGPCRPGNEILKGVLDNNPGKFAVIKYQYNFPGTGDPYFTLEGAARGNYYGGINSVPRMQIDGQWNNNPNGFTQNIFNQYQRKPSFVEIKPTQVVNVTDKSIEITAKVTPLISLTGNYRLRIAVVERTTSRNRKSNGETEFYWVMKKMLPDPAGLTINLTNVNVEQTFTQSFTFQGDYRLPASAVNTSGQYIGINLATEHSVEEFDDLIAVVFVQNEATKEVLQAEWSSAGIYSSANEVKMEELGAVVYPNPAANQFSIKLPNNKLGKVAIYDLTGKRVMDVTLMGEETEVDCNSLQNGLYMVEITVDGKTQVQKLNIAR